MTAIDMTSLSSRLAKAFSAGWPAWQGGDVHQDGPEVCPSIRLSARLQKTAAKMQLPARPETIIAEVRTQSRTCGGDAAAFADFWAGLEHDLISFVYASNLIESAGTGLPATGNICRAVFRGEHVDEHIDQDHAAYQQHLDYLEATLRKPDLANVVISRREAINHAKALVYLVEKVVLDKEPLSEAVILETHRILYDGVGGRVAAGRYRDFEVAIAFHELGEKKRYGTCMRAGVVPAYMRAVLRHLGDEADEAEAGGCVDPYWLAARYKHQFLVVHPFGDGNGPMSRLVLNVLLLKYAGHVVFLGGSKFQRDEYLRVVRRGRGRFEAEDMKVAFREQTSHARLARLVLAKSWANLEWMDEWARRVEAKGTTSVGSFVVVRTRM